VVEQVPLGAAGVGCDVLALFGERQRSGPGVDVVESLSRCIAPGVVDGDGVPAVRSRQRE
jgi:hypothetical protein